jgi:hypothetical protein
MTKSKQTVVLSGDESDPEVKASLRKIKKAGRNAVAEKFPKCQNGQCSCTGICILHRDQEDFPA